MAIVFSAMQAGNANSLAPDYNKAMISAARIFALFDREPVIDNMSEDGKKPQVSLSSCVCGHAGRLVKREQLRLKRTQLCMITKISLIKPYRLHNLFLHRDLHCEDAKVR